MRGRKWSRWEGVECQAMIPAAWLWTCSSWAVLVSHQAIRSSASYQWL